MTLTATHRMAFGASKRAMGRMIEEPELEPSFRQSRLFDTRKSERWLLQEMTLLTCMGQLKLGPSESVRVWSNSSTECRMKNSSHLAWGQSMGHRVIFYAIREDDGVTIGAMRFIANRHHRGPVRHISRIRDVA